MLHASVGVEVLDVGRVIFSLNVSVSMSCELYPQTKVRLLAGTKLSRLPPKPRTEVEGLMLLGAGALLPVVRSY